MPHAEQIFFLVLISLYSLKGQSHHYSVFRRFLEGVPPDDPIEEIRQTKVKFLNAVGIGKVLGGNAQTTFSRVSSPVRVTQPQLHDVTFYYNYTLVSMCESSLETWDCAYCKIIGSHIQLIRIQETAVYNTKWFITLDSRRAEFVLTYRPAYNLANLMIIMGQKALVRVDGSEIRVHGGVFQAVEADFAQIVATLKHAISGFPTYKLVITGYSLGGGMAAVLVFLLKYRNSFPDTQMELYTYSQGRTGNKAFADYMNVLDIPVARAVNRGDLLTHLPAAILGYYHHHNELFLDVDGRGIRTAQYCSTEFYEDPHCGQIPIANGALRLSVIKHLTYFGQDILTCARSSMVEFMLQSVWPLRKRLSQKVRQVLPKFEFGTSALQDMEYLQDGGLSNLYKAASLPSTTDNIQYRSRNQIVIPRDLGNTIRNMYRCGIKNNFPFFTNSLLAFTQLSLCAQLEGDK